MTKYALLSLAMWHAALLAANGEDDFTEAMPKSCSAKSGKCKGRSLLATKFDFRKASSKAEPAALTVPLQRSKGGKKGVFFYIGNITVGYPPQKLQVLFDTASGNVILPHSRCKSPACLQHKRYSSWHSTMSEDVFSNGTRMRPNQRLIPGRHMRQKAKMSYTAADLGDGFVDGPYVRDRVCLSDMNANKICTNPVMVVAMSEDDVPFGAMPNDGILGMSLGGLSVKSPFFNFLQTLLASRPGLKPQFGMTFGQFGGELTIGGYNPSSLAAPLQWFSVYKPEVGYWQIQIVQVRVGSKVVDTCAQGCVAVVDTGTSRLGVQKSRFPAFKDALSTSLATGLGKGCHGPDITFDLGGMTVVLGPEDYTDEQCGPDVGSLDLDDSEYNGFYTFGEMVLRHYLVVFDWKDKMMGFAPAAGERPDIGKPAASAKFEQSFV